MTSDTSSHTGKQYPAPPRATLSAATPVANPIKPEPERPLGVDPSGDNIAAASFINMGFRGQVVDSTGRKVE